MRTPNHEPRPTPKIPAKGPSVPSKLEADDPGKVASDIADDGSSLSHLMAGTAEERQGVRLPRLHDHSGHGGASDPALELLRPLARRAVGMSGADIERLVREARGRARRAGRPLTWQDIDDLVSAGRPVISDDLRWRLAIHECGHVLVYLALDRGGDVEIITVDAPEGGFVRLNGHDDSLLSEQGAMENLAVMLAGRRAEIAFFGDALSASGGAPESDLGRATELAIALETSLGFGRRHQLVFRPVRDPATQLVYDRDLAERVDARLSEADAIATDIIGDHMAAIAMLASEVARHRTLEGDHLRRALDPVKRQLEDWQP